MPPWDMGFSVSAFLGARYLINVRCKILIGAEYQQCGSILYIGAKFQ